jgi:hypothetical protein
MRISWQAPWQEIDQEIKTYFLALKAGYQAESTSSPLSF